jgi:alpha-ketoglutarate-dependent taurine dioxygenase
MASEPAISISKDRKGLWFDLSVPRQGGDSAATPTSGSTSVSGGSGKGKGPSVLILGSASTKVITEALGHPRGDTARTDPLVVEVPVQWVEDVNVENFTKLSHQRLAVPGCSGSHVIESVEWIAVARTRAVLLSKNGKGGEGKGKKDQIVGVKGGPNHYQLVVTVKDESAPSQPAPAADKSAPATGTSNGPASSNSPAATPVPTPSPAVKKMIIPAEAIALLDPSARSKPFTTESLTPNFLPVKDLWTSQSPGFRPNVDPAINSKYLEGDASSPQCPGGKMFFPSAISVENYFQSPEANRLRALTALETYGFCIVTDKSLAATAARSFHDGNPAGAEDTIKLRGNAGEKILLSMFRVLKNTHYGAYSTWRANVAVAVEKETSGVHKKARAAGQKVDPNESHMDGAWDDSWLDLHTDNTYFREPPKVQGFGCLYRTNKTMGGYTTLVDGFAVAEHIRKQDSAAFKLLSTVPVCGHYVKEDQHLIGVRPCFELNPETGALSRFTFNNSDRASFKISPHLPNRSDLESMYRAYALLHRTVHTPSFQVRFLLKPGALCCFDNHRVAHGRTAFSGPRVMGGAYIGVDDYYSSVLSVVKSGKPATLIP